VIEIKPRGGQYLDQSPMALQQRMTDALRSLGTTLPLGTQDTMLAASFIDLDAVETGTAGEH